MTQRTLAPLTNRAVPERAGKTHSSRLRELSRISLTQTNPEGGQPGDGFCSGMSDGRRRPPVHRCSIKKLTRGTLVQTVRLAGASGGPSQVLSRLQIDPEHKSYAILVFTRPDRHPPSPRGPSRRAAWWRRSREPRGRCARGRHSSRRAGRGVGMWAGRAPG